jgi:hypothetical protein
MIARRTEKRSGQRTDNRGFTENKSDVLGFGFGPAFVNHWRVAVPTPAPLPGPGRRVKKGPGIASRAFVILYDRILSVSLSARLRRW